MFDDAIYTFYIYMVLNYMKGEREMGKARQRSEQRVCMCVS